jgi:4-hydroxy-tetrahydrodipicolinate reductase
MTTRIAIHGIAGRMGRAIVSALETDDDADVVSGIERPGGPYEGADLGAMMTGSPNGIWITSDLAVGLAHANVVIDFSTSDATVKLLEAAAKQKVAVVIGTTGLDDRAFAALAAVQAVAPVVIAPNMSVGVNVLFHLAARAAEILGPSFDAEIVEMHHRNKVDAPSGTAVRLGEVVARAKALDPKTAIVHGRSGQVGRRPEHEIGVMTLRGGSVIGDHTLVLAGPLERVEITHRAESRDIFAQGAIRAAKWAVGKRPGRYDMADVLGIPR